MPEHIPFEFRRRPQWVVWRYEMRDGKKTKVPYNPSTGARASTTAPTTWTTFECAKAKQKHYNGIGYVFNGSCICGIDPYRYHNPQTGEIESWALEIIKAIDSYTEISPSNTGAHRLLLGKLPAEGNRKGQIEMYDCGRCFCMTGNHLDGTPQLLEARHSELGSLHKQIFGSLKTEKKGTGSRSAGTLDLIDQQIIEKARDATNGAKFQQLFDARYGEPAKKITKTFTA